ncbi:MAG: DUF359 domain-containing protein [Candidatus Aenigmarchaeota archaeon]|nr:DUF359 domain-containing protein [Candidatus Aenigmarchaeota archaeon]
MYKLPRRMRSQLRKPLGRVFRDTEALVNYLRKSKPSKLITVGDVCSRELIIAGIIPDVIVIDRKTRRRKVKWNVKFPGRVIGVKNAPSTISDGLIAAVRNSFGKRTMIDVEGEEDLAVLPAIKHCPAGSAVIYGLWFRGVVAVKVDKRVKNKVGKILKRMRYEN